MRMNDMSDLVDFLLKAGGAQPIVDYGGGCIPCGPCNLFMPELPDDMIIIAPQAPSFDWTPVALVAGLLLWSWWIRRSKEPAVGPVIIAAAGSPLQGRPSRAGAVAAACVLGLTCLIVTPPQAQRVDDNVPLSSSERGLGYTLPSASGGCVGMGS